MASCHEVKVIATHHLEDIRAKLSGLKKLERLPAKTVARCSGKKVPNCPILDIRRASILHLYSWFGRWPRHLVGPMSALVKSDRPDAFRFESASPQNVVF
jgi:hypothetical protein